MGESRLLADMSRVMSRHEDVAARLPGFLVRIHTRATWRHEDLVALFRATNLVAYHLVASQGPACADNVLREQLRAAYRLSSRAALPALALDPFLNRIRLVAITGRPHDAVAAINELLASDSPAECDDEPASLLFASRLALDADRDAVRAALHLEKVLILWRTGELAAMNLSAAVAVIDQLPTVASPIQRELRLRLRLGHDRQAVFTLRSEDTLKRALHRALIWLDVSSPSGGQFHQVLLTGMRRLHDMSFVNPGTPTVWARAVLQWSEGRSAHLAFSAQEALSGALSRFAVHNDRDLDSTLGHPIEPMPLKKMVTAEHADALVSVLRSVPQVVKGKSLHVQ